MTSPGDKSPFSKSKQPGKRLHDEDGGRQDFSTNTKRSKYSEHIPGFRETGYMKLSERPVVPEKIPSRMLKPNSSFESTKLNHLEEGSSKVVGKTGSEKKRENGSPREQSDGLFNHKTVSQSRAFSSNCPSAKNQPLARSAQLVETRGSNFRSERVGGPDSPSRFMSLNESNESRKGKNVNVIAESSVLENTKFKERKCVTLLEQSNRLVGGKTLSQRSSGRRSGDHLDEDGSSSPRKLQKMPLKEHLGARPHDAKAAIHLTGNYFSLAKESNSPSSSQGEEAICRENVITTLRLFDETYEEERQKELKGRGKAGERASKRATDNVKQKIKWDERDKTGAICGIQIGDQFQFKGQLVLVGLHFDYHGGISYIKRGEFLLATSIVDSNRYDNKMANDHETIFFPGQGRNPSVSQKKAEDLKLKGGNLALKNSITADEPVRVIRKVHTSSKVKVFRYDGLYMVIKCTKEIGEFGKQIFMFELKRKAGQPKLPDSMTTEPRKPKKHYAIGEENNISQGQETSTIYAVNDQDDEKPPRFSYTTKMIYPERCYKPSMITSGCGCDCVDGCSDSGVCSCVVKNGGGIPFNENGTLSNNKPTIYECGPFCKCPPFCQNRVSQRGVMYQFEIFKTSSSGWGVRSRNHIAKGSFICEYTGVLVPYKEVRELANSSDYVYVIDDNESGFAIDATEHGNIGRFIKHSVDLPNLYAQRVLYDHDGKRMPHVMLFASKNIPPKLELTFDHTLRLSKFMGSSQTSRSSSGVRGMSSD